ncbi:MAG: hypothetical protein LBQ73_07050 [Tannerellaceae bacterium]|jgi:hypothetical protein|nr:hypothetical protein [Tannerellaceae bacterium]
MVRINESVVAQLILDKKVDEKTASDIFYTSTTFVQLSDKATNLYLKPWQEIYKMLENELR